MEYIIFPLGFLTVIWFLIYILIQVVKNKSVSGGLFLLFFSLFMVLLGFSQQAFTAFWWLINGIQTIFLIFLSSHTLATLISYRKRNRKLAQVEEQGEWPEVAVVVCVFNEEEVIGETMRAISNLDYPKDKIHLILHDDNSSDRTYEFALEHKDQFTILRRGEIAEKGKAAAINRIVPELRQELVCVFDCDSLPSKDFLKRAVRHFKEPEVALVQGRNIEYNHSTFISRLVAFDQDNIHFSVYFPKTFLKGMVMFEGRAGVFRKDVFVDLGGYDTRLPTEDWDFGCRVQVAGRKSVYDHTAKNFEQAPEDLEGYFKQRYRWLGSTIFSMLKSLGPVLKSPGLAVSQKIDYFFTTTYQLWSLSVNLFGFLAIMNLLVGHQLEVWYTSIMFLLVVIILVIPSIFAQRKWKYIFYFPVMYVYYWTFTFVITEVVINHWVIRKKVRYHKATHVNAKERLHKLESNTNP